MAIHLYGVMLPEMLPWPPGYYQRSSADTSMPRSIRMSHKIGYQ